MQERKKNLPVEIEVCGVNIRIFFLYQVKDEKERQKYSVQRDEKK
jgi:hypothetical protein